MSKKGQAEDILCFSSVFHLMILYEMRDWYRFQLTLYAAYRQLYKLKKKRDLERESYYGWLSAKLEGIDYKLYVARNPGLAEPG